MKLTAYLIDGEPVGKIVVSYDEEQLNGNPPFKAEESVSSGYEDISSITYWDMFGSWTGKDFKVIRYQINLLRISIGYANLSLEEKILANKYFASGVEYFNAQVTPTEQEAFFRNFLKPNSDIARKSRDLAVTGWVNTRVYTGILDFGVVNQLILYSENLRTKYLRDGTSGIGYGDTIEGIVNFVMNDNGFTPFTIVGVNTITKTFSVAGDKTAEFYADKVMRIRLSTGNDGAYTVVSSVFDATNTNIIVAEAIPNATADGKIYVRGLMYYAGLTFAMQTELYNIYWNGIY